MHQIATKAILNRELQKPSDLPNGADLSTNKIYFINRNEDWIDYSSLNSLNGIRRLSHRQSIKYFLEPWKTNYLIIYILCFLPQKTCMIHMIITAMSAAQSPFA